MIILSRIHLSHTNIPNGLSDTAASNARRRWPTVARALSEAHRRLLNPTPCSHAARQQVESVIGYWGYHRLKLPKCGRLRERIATRWAAWQRLAQAVIRMRQTDPVSPHRCMLSTLHDHSRRRTLDCLAPSGADMCVFSHERELVRRLGSMLPVTLAFVMSLKGRRNAEVWRADSIGALSFVMLHHQGRIYDRNCFLVAPTDSLLQTGMICITNCAGVL
jgi:hypothetical protein